MEEGRGREEWWEWDDVDTANTTCVSIPIQILSSSSFCLPVLRQNQVQVLLTVTVLTVRRAHSPVRFSDADVAQTLARQSHPSFTPAQIDAVAKKQWDGRRQLSSGWFRLFSLPRSSGPSVCGASVSG